MRFLRYLFPWPFLRRLERENAQLRLQLKGVPVLLEFIKRRHRLDVDFNRGTKLSLAGTKPRP